MTSPDPDSKREAKPLRLNDRLRSFRFAIRGILLMLRTQHNAWLHAAATIVVLIAGWCLRLTISEWCWIVAAIVAVWTAESLNTALELLADAASPDFHPLVEQSKDVAAGAVLICALGALTIGLLILGPRLWQNL
jgi:diacylglycerol kinase (ATP)